MFVCRYGLYKNNHGKVYKYKYKCYKHYYCNNYIKHFCWKQILDYYKFKMLMKGD